MKSLLDEIALREASLLDAGAEHERGELDEERYRVICAREEAALVVARAQLAALDEEAPRRRRTRRRSLLAVAGISFGVAIVIVLLSAMSPRQPGTSITGSVSLGKKAQVSQLLTEAEADTANGNASAALVAYQGVLALEPSNVAALTQAGWLEFSAGSSAKDATAVSAGVASLRRAIEVAPGQPAAHLYYAIAALSTRGNRSLATSQMRQFLALKPSAALRAVAAPYLRALHLAHAST